MRKSSQARHANCTVDLEALQPGDVLLTTQKTFNSWVIRKATRSIYSHAILYVGEGLIIESVPSKGIAFGLLQLVKAETDCQQNKYAMFATVPKAALVHVYRHSSLARKSLNFDEKLDLMIRLNRVLPNKWGRDYSLLESLGMATPLLRWAPRTKAALLRLAGRLGADRGKVVPSEFCSELVANALSDFGYPPFRQLIAGTIPSPQSFADSRVSNMVRHFNAEARPDQSRPADQRRLERAEKNQQLHISVGLNHYRKDQHQTLAALDELNLVLKKHIQDQQKAINRLLEEVGQ